MRVSLGVSILLLLAASVSGQEPHRFYDRWGKAEFTTAATLAAWDAAQTCHNVMTGGHEDWLPTQKCAPAVAIIGGQVVAQEWLAYRLHRRGWHRMERMARLVTIQGNVRGLVYSKKHGAW